MATATTAGLQKLDGRMNRAEEFTGILQYGSMALGGTVLVLLAHQQFPDAVNVNMMRQLLSQFQKVFIAAVTVMVYGYMLSIYPGVTSFKLLVGYIVKCSAICSLRFSSI